MDMLFTLYGHVIYLMIGMALLLGHSTVYSTQVLSLLVRHCVDSLYSVASYCRQGVSTMGGGGVGQ